jgi:alkanesulfonate monooxygenase SsuD/methylene tetrahydromethanopterin reductase-like flavin-dependent oxidoreductase (luciferase family)
MRVGVSLRSAYGVDDARLGARWMIQQAAAAEAAGLDSLFVGDHHVTRDTSYYQNSPILGRLLAEWGDRPSGALYLLPLWHPVLVAEQVATLASVAAGRFVLQCALGEGAGQFAAMSTDLASRRARFDAGLDVVRRLLAGEEVTTDGPWSVTGARIGPQPPEPVDVWIGASAPPAIDRAARLGDGWIASPAALVEDASAQLELYRERCSAHGRPTGTTVIRRDVHVGADDADARRTAAPVVAGGYRGLPPDALVVGGVDTVAHQLRALADLGFDEVLVRHLVDDQQEVLASFGRLAEVRAVVAGA